MFTGILHLLLFFVLTASSALRLNSWRLLVLRIFRVHGLFWRLVSVHRDGNEVGVLGRVCVSTCAKEQRGCVPPLHRYAWISVSIWYYVSRGASFIQYVTQTARHRSKVLCRRRGRLRYAKAAEGCWAQQFNYRSASWAKGDWYFRRSELYQSNCLSVRISSTLHSRTFLLLFLHWLSIYFYRTKTIDQICNRSPISFLALLPHSSILTFVLPFVRIGTNISEWNTQAASYVPCLNTLMSIVVSDPSDVFGRKLLLFMAVSFLASVPPRFWVLAHGTDLKRTINFPLLMFICW